MISNCRGKFKVLNVHTGSPMDDDDYGVIFGSHIRIMHTIGSNPQPFMLETGAIRVTSWSRQALYFSFQSLYRSRRLPTDIPPLAGCFDPFSPRMGTTTTMKECWVYYLQSETPSPSCRLARTIVLLQKLLSPTACIQLMCFHTKILTFFCKSTFRRPQGIFNLL